MLDNANSYRRNRGIKLGDLKNYRVISKDKTNISCYITYSWIIIATLYGVIYNEINQYTASA